jgi:hypothetical protein
MNYIQRIADIIRLEMSDEVLPKSDNLNQLFCMYALLLLVKGQDVTAEDVHNTWATWMNHENPQHRSILPFSALSKDVQEQDQPFVQAIKRAYNSSIVS